MKTILIVLAVIVIVGVGLGGYMGWFTASSRNDTSNPNVTFSVDTEKIQSDTDKAVDKAQDMGHDAVDKVTPASE